MTHAAHTPDHSVLSLALEQLETRRLLAGEIAVHVSSAGDVELVGDSEGNEVRLSTVNGDLQIEGLNGTQVFLNGTQANIQTIDLGADAAVDRDLKIRMLGGPDFVSLDGVVVSRNLNTNLGTGDDVFEAFTAEIKGRTTVLGGAGKFRDTLMVSSTMEGPVLFSTGANRDGLPDRVIVETATVNSQLTVKGGSGETFVRLTNSSLAGPIVVNTGAGDDFVSLFSQMLNVDMRCNLGSGDDLLRFDSMSLQGEVSCRMGAGNDSIDLTVLTLFGDLTLDGGGGTDDLHVDSNTMLNVPPQLRSIEELMTT